jgi:hypothetical protein
MMRPVIKQKRKKQRSWVIIRNSDSISRPCIWCLNKSLKLLFYLQLTYYYSSVWKRFIALDPNGTGMVDKIGFHVSPCILTEWQ